MGVMVSLGCVGSVRAATSAPPSITLVPATVLAFDADLKAAEAKAAETNLFFTFWVTNVCATNVLILNVSTSCGCTAAQSPSLPWLLQPGESGPIKVSLDVKGYRGILLKGVEITSTAGIKALVVRANLPAPSTVPTPAPAGGGPPPARPCSRPAGLDDRQAVFAGDCARCHAAPAHGKSGRDLYCAICNVCHESSRHSGTAPQLGGSEIIGSKNLLQQTIMAGRPGTLMPAFAASQGGPLTDKQILSLVTYLNEGQPADAGGWPHPNPRPGARTTHRSQ